MKKILTLGIAALVAIVMSGCQFNLFAAFDKLDIPSAAELLDQAETDPEGLVDDVQEYVDSDSITEDNADDIADALAEVYDDAAVKPSGMTDAEWEEVQQRAAVLAGEIIIDNDPDTRYVVENIVSSVTAALESGISDPEAIIGGIFPSDMTQSEFSAILLNLSNAAAAYKDFAGTINPGTADWMSSAEAGDMVQYAVIAIVITDINADPDVSETELYNSVMYGTDIPDEDYVDPFSTPELIALLDFAGLDL
ncbi:MAG: hypothetical protein KAR21_15560 [Spirochaetales bacterium]|nr:hypothetical protein [Spirochaetales bacterium]